MNREAVEQAFAPWTIEEMAEGRLLMSAMKPVAQYILELEAAAARLAVERAEFRRNAERYRWLRGQFWNSDHLCCVANPKKSVVLGSDCPSGDRLDEAIDAAMLAASQQKVPPAADAPTRTEWFCDTCDRVIEPREVTFDERHDERAGGCGVYVGTIKVAASKQGGP